jgi:hypothetical protein
MEGRKEERMRRQKDQEKIYHAARLKPPMEADGYRNTSNSL